MNYNNTSTNTNSQSSINHDYDFENDLNEAIKLSLQDFKNESSTSFKASGSTYVNFNTNGSFFISDVYSKGTHDLFDPNLILENILYFFKLEAQINKNELSSSSSTSPPIHTNLHNSPDPQTTSTSTLTNDYLNEAINILFGKDQYRTLEKYEIETWCNHGFVSYPQSEIFWGLMQFRSGPCGVLAAIQSYMLRSLLFNYSLYGELSFLLQNKTPEEVLLLLNDMFFNYISMRMTEFPKEFLYTVPLVESLCNILYNVTPNSMYHIILYHNLKDPNDCIGSLLSQSTFTYKTFSNINSVANYLTSNLNVLTGRLGLISFLLSVLFTRSLEIVKDDMDDFTQPLIGSYGHCSQELVNLLLHGKAVSNVFNGDKVIEDNSSTPMKLKGISVQNTLGFLTDLEALRLYKVGSFYKNPLVPIWVVSSSNHYTVLFGLDGSGCFISQSEMIEQNLTEAWTKIDTEDNKYIEVNSLGNLLDLLGIKHLLKDAMNSIEIVSGLVLWTNMLAWYSSVIGKNNQTQRDAASVLTLFHYNGKDNKTPLHKVTIEKDLMIIGDIPSNEVDANIVGTASESYRSIAKVIWTRWPRTNVNYSVVPSK